MKLGDWKESLLSASREETVNLEEFTVDREHDWLFLAGAKFITELLPSEKELGRALWKLDNPAGTIEEWMNMDIEDKEPHLEKASTVLFFMQQKVETRPRN